MAMEEPIEETTGMDELEEVVHDSGFIDPSLSSTSSTSSLDDHLDVVSDETPLTNLDATICPEAVDSSDDTDLDDYISGERVLLPPVAKPAVAEKIKVIIQGHQGQQTPIDIGPNCLVSDLKAEFQKYSGIAAGEQRLLFGSKQLADNMTLRQSKITTGARLQSTLRLHSG